MTTRSLLVAAFLLLGFAASIDAAAARPAPQLKSSADARRASTRSRSLSLRSTPKATPRPRSSSQSSYVSQRVSRVTQGEDRAAPSSSASSPLRQRAGSRLSTTTVQPASRRDSIRSVVSAPPSTRAVPKPREVARRYSSGSFLGRSGRERAAIETALAQHAAPKEPRPPKLDKSAYPENRGFRGPPRTTELAAGTRIDRYGPDGGRYTSPAGTPFGQRALAPGSDKLKLHSYEVVQPIIVRSGTAAPAFGEPGGGTQHFMGQSVRDLVRSGHLRPID